MAGKTTDTIVDITRRFEWEVSKEQIEGCAVGDGIASPNFIVNIESKVFTWGLVIGIPAKAAVEQDQDINEDLVFIGLNLLPGNDSLKVEIEGIGIKTENGYWPAKQTENMRRKSKIVSKIETFGGRNEEKARLCVLKLLTYLGPKEDFLKNKITVVATLRFYVDRDVYIMENKREQNMLTQIRSISDLDSLADFTVICGGREFKCHRNILASRSTVFKAMILNEQFEESRQNSTTIEKASPDMVEAMLEFISNGKIPNDIEEKAIDLILLADRYDLQDLIEICESSMVDNLTGENVIETLIAIDLHVPNSPHREKILDFIKKEAANVVKSSHWNKFCEKYPDLVAEIVLSLASLAARVTDS